jgi:hypothetical protein
MTRKRARITDENNPLTSTDEILAGFQQLSQSTSQQVESPAIKEIDDIATQKAKKSAIAKSDNIASQQVDMSVVNQVSNLESQQVNKLTTQKATFQLSQSVLEQLDRFHLELQLELGKKNTPYKEVIVEEAISQLLIQLADDQQSIIQKLWERQQQRK